MVDIPNSRDVFLSRAYLRLSACGHAQAGAETGQKGPSRTALYLGHFYISNTFSRNGLNRRYF